MTQQILRVPIFVSSPNDMGTERQIVQRVVAELNERPSFKEKYRIEALLYENEVVPMVGDFAQMIVDRYMNVTDSYIVICMLWSRMGTPFTHPETGEKFQSGTEYEFQMAYQTKSDVPHILLYRKQPHNPQADIAQTAKVDNFFKKFEGDKVELKGLYKTFSKPSEFRKLLSQHIEQILIEYPPEKDVNVDTLEQENTNTNPIQGQAKIQADKIENSTIITDIANSNINIGDQSGHGKKPN